MKIKDIITEGINVLSLKNDLEYALKDSIQDACMAMVEWMGEHPNQHPRQYLMGQVEHQVIMAFNESTHDDVTVSFEDLDKNTAGEYVSETRSIYINTILLDKLYDYINDYLNIDEYHIDMMSDLGDLEYKIEGWDIDIRADNMTIGAVIFTIVDIFLHELTHDIQYSSGHPDKGAYNGYDEYYASKTEIGAYAQQAANRVIRKVTGGKPIDDMDDEELSQTINALKNSKEAIMNNDISQRYKSQMGNNPKVMNRFYKQLTAIINAYVDDYED